MMKVKWNQDAVTKRLKKIKDAETQANIYAINRTMPSLRSEARRLFNLHFQVKLSMSRYRKRFLAFKASKANLYGRLRFLTEPFPLDDFKPQRLMVESSKGRRAGASVEIHGRRIHVPQGFIGKLKGSGTKTVFHRSKLKTDGEGRKSWQIARLNTESIAPGQIAQFFSGKYFQAKLRILAKQLLDKNLKQQIKYLINK